MTSTATVHRFANALVDVVLGPRGVDPATATGDLRSFADVIAANANLQNVLSSPAVSVARKRQVIKRLCEALGTSTVIRNFLLVLSDHRRLPALAHVLDAFDLRLDERMGFVRADIRSADELPEEQKRNLTDQLARLAGRQVRPRFQIDPSLIGGATAQLGSTVYDGSVRGQLQTLRARLALK